MKATGIVRRIDDLGRVVIPKEIRRTMRIREGDPLEIYTSAGEVIFKKYSAMGELSEFASQYAESLSHELTLPVVICDRDHCVAAAGISKKHVLEKRVTPFLENKMELRQAVNLGASDSEEVLQGVEQKACAVAPILSAGDIGGAVVLLQGEQERKATESDIKLIGVAATFLGKQME